MTRELPTVSIKGNDYVMVKDRIVAFNDAYPFGSIETELVRYEGGQVIVKATVSPNDGPRKGMDADSVVPMYGRKFTGYSQAKESDGMINKSSALENAETSAVGRALAMMGIGVIESVASADEIVKATSTVMGTYKGVQVVASNVAASEPLPWEGEPNDPEKDEVLDKAEGTHPINETTCLTCGAPAVFKSGVSKKTGKPWSAYFCSTDDKSHARFV